MKILFVNKFLYPRGGAETYFLKLGVYFEQAGHQVSYFGMDDEKNTVGNAYGLYTQNMDFHSSKIQRFLYPFKILYSLDAYRKMKKLIRMFHPDVIHLNNINFQLTPSIIDAAWKAGVPVIQTVHDSQMVCPGHLLYRPSTGQLCQRCVKGSKWNCVRYRCIHGSFVKSLLGSMEGILYSWKRNYDRVQLYICPSQFMESVLLSKPRYRGKTRVIPNFIELPDRDYGSKADYILYFGRLSEEKGINFFLELCDRFPDVSFKIAGSGPYEEECKKRKNVEYLGLLTGEVLKKTIAQARFVIYPSICYENCPLSILEAISLGTPVISSSRGGSMELVDNGKTGILIEEPFSVNKLEKVVKKLLERPEWVEEMTRHCISSREKFFTLEKYGKELERIYRQIQG